MLGDEQPNDELNNAAEAGPALRLSLLPRGRRSRIRSSARESRAPTTRRPLRRWVLTSRRSASKFYTGTMFPAEYRKQLFIVNHGSWNRSAQVSHTGYRIMVAKVQGSKVTSYEPFAEGFLQKAEGAEVARQAWGQPVDLLELPDGSMLVSDDRADAIYRISTAIIGTPLVHSADSSAALTDRRRAPDARPPTSDRAACRRSGRDRRR